MDFKLDDSVNRVKMAYSGQHSLFQLVGFTLTLRSAHLTDFLKVFFLASGTASPAKIDTISGTFLGYLESNTILYTTTKFSFIQKYSLDNH